MEVSVNMYYLPHQNLFYINKNMWYNYIEVLYMKKYNFIILIEKDEDGIYTATVPALRGCHTQANTVEELLPRIKEAIELCLEVDHDELMQNEFVGIQQVEVSI
jgi:predicted RNase H-like HicB family nuclease